MSLWYLGEVKTRLVAVRNLLRLSWDSFHSRKPGFRYCRFSETELPVKSILGNSAIFQALLHWVRTLRWGAWSNKEE